MRRCNATVARAGLGLVAASLVLDCVALVVDVIAGRRIVSGMAMEEVGLEFGSTISSLANLAVPAAVLVGGLAFVWWFHCAYSTYSMLSVAARGREARYRPIWAVVGWLVPILNLVRPPRIMSDLTGRSRSVTPWWTVWLVAGAIQLALRFVSPTTQQGWIYWQLSALFADLLLLISLCFAFLLIDDARRAVARIDRRWLVGDQVDRAQAMAMA